MEKLWLVIPCYNEEEVLPETSMRLYKIMADMITNAAYLLLSGVINYLREADDRKGYCAQQSNQPEIVSPRQTVGDEATYHRRQYGRKNRDESEPCQTAQHAVFVGEITYPNLGSKQHASGGQRLQRASDVQHMNIGCKGTHDAADQTCGDTQQQQFFLWHAIAKPSEEHVTAHQPQVEVKKVRRGFRLTDTQVGGHKGNRWRKDVTGHAYHQCGTYQ